MKPYTSRTSIFKAANQSIMLSLVLLASAVLLSTSSGSNTTEINAAPNDLTLSLSLFATNLESPVGITNAGPGDNRLFVIERAGRIKIILADGSVLSSPFLNITDKVESSSREQGLLGLAFHPDYATNAYIYVNYTHTSQPGVTQTRISRFQVSGNPAVADPNSEDVLITIVQPFANHNAGDIHFGPNGFLYIPLGDGGGNRASNAQDLGTLLGKIVRIDVDSSEGGLSPDCKGDGSGHYSVPATNPFIKEDGACDEIWALGLRNPWQSSFDRLTGDLFIGDVGQGAWEEVDFQPSTSGGGENYGWPCFEGNEDPEFDLPNCGPREDYVFPIFEYRNPFEGCSVIGGYMYRGNLFPALYGHYLLTDFCSGIFWDLALTVNDWLSTRHDQWTIPDFVAFGEDARGEMYVANRVNGYINRLSGYDKNTFDERAYLPFVSK